MTVPSDTRKLYQQVASTVMASIMSGKYKPGERLPSERDLAESRHGSGIYVSDKPAPLEVGGDPDVGAFELTEARPLFEGEAAALAATTISDDRLEELERIVAAMVLDIRHKSPLCVYMLERARRVGVQPRVSEHRRILAALRKHDAKAARAAMRDHVARVIEDLLEATEPEALDGTTVRSSKRRHDYTRRLTI